MSSQSIVVPCPVLIKYEKKYSHLVDRLDLGSRNVCESCVLHLMKTMFHLSGEPIAALSRPDQPSSHVPPVPAADEFS